MTGITVHSKQAQAYLRCDAHGCEAKWNSPTYAPKRWGDDEKACAAAFDAGWRIFNGARSHRTYCPAHGPKAPMELLHGPTDHADGSQDV